MKPMYSNANNLTVLDQIGAGLGIFLGLGLLAAPFLITPTFMGMFEDFGSLKMLPWVTLLVSRTWFPLVCALPGLALVVAGLTGRGPLFRRRLMITASFFMGLAAFGFYVYGMYAPIFDLAGSVIPQQEKQDDPMPKGEFDSRKAELESYLKKQPYPDVHDFQRYRKFHEAVVAKIRKVLVEPGAKRSFSLSEFVVRRPIKTCPVCPDKKPVVAYLDEDGILYVLFRTLDLHHGGRFGYVFCDGSTRSSLAMEELFLGEGAPGQITSVANHWYIYRAD